MPDSLFIVFLFAALLATNVTPATTNACYVTSTERGQYVVQTGGDAGTIDVYVNGAYVTTISRKNVLWYATKDQTARVAGYDTAGRVC